MVICNIDRGGEFLIKLKEIFQRFQVNFLKVGGLLKNCLIEALKDFTKNFFKISLDYFFKEILKK